VRGRIVRRRFCLARFREKHAVRQACGAIRENRGADAAIRCERGGLTQSDEGIIVQFLIVRGGGKLELGTSERVKRRRVALALHEQFGCVKGVIEIAGADKAVNFVNRNGNGQQIVHGRTFLSRTLTVPRPDPLA